MFSHLLLQNTVYSGLEEKKRQCDLSNRLIVIDPADTDRSVGMNILERGQEGSAFVQIAEFTELLRHRWHLETLGPRTEELLRNSLYVLCENSLTLLEVEPLLTNFAFRTSCLREVRNGEVRRYFEVRYNKLSEGMRRLSSEPILNKISGFTADPHFRHIVGQQESTFSWREAMEAGSWVVINLDNEKSNWRHTFTLQVMLSQSEIQQLKNATGDGSIIFAKSGQTKNLLFRGVHILLRAFQGFLPEQSCV